MKGGARRRTISSDLRSPPSHPVQNEINDQVNDQVEYGKQKREQELQQQHRSTNDGDDAGNEYDEDDDEDYEEDDYQSGDVDVHGEGADGDESKGEEERPKLAEGFYEIEAVRRRRVRKGEKQYLIKWRGWPESSNTWEPVVNLMACADVIDAFEESWKSGKHRSNRKRKRKNSVAPTPQPKKKQKPQVQVNQRSPAATYDVPSVKIKIIEDPLPVPIPSLHNFSNGTEHNIGTTSNETVSLMGSPQIQQPNEKTEPDLKLPELKLLSENGTEFAIHIQEDRVGNGERKVEEGTGVIRVSPRIGAKRRKSGAVKRFKQEESNLAAQNDDSDLVTQDEVKSIGVMGDGLGSNSIGGGTGNVCSITKILKPVNYSTSVHDDIEEVSVSFLVRRSNGEEVVVDNKYFKENNPLMLINFYEQHLRYNNPAD